MEVYFVLNKIIKLYNKLKPVDKSICPIVLEKFEYLRTNGVKDSFQRLNQCIYQQNTLLQQAVENLPFQFLQQFVENLQSFENKTHTNASYSVNLLHASCHLELFTA